eukprot:9590175-Alexandrium_andersonii.AAC.1
MIDASTFGQHVLAVVAGATFCEARLEARQRAEKKRKRKHKRAVEASLLGPAAGEDDATDQDNEGGESSG